MPLDTYVEDIETVDENLRNYYKEVEDGEGYILDANPINGYTVENTENLKSALGKERNDRKSYEKKYNSLSKKFEGIDVDQLQNEAQEYKDKYEELAAIDPESEAAKLAEKKVKAAEDKVSSKLEEKQLEWQKQYDTEVNSRDGKISKLTEKVRELMVDNVATNALVEGGIIQDQLELILPKVTGSMKLVENENGEFVAEVVDKDGVARVKSDGHNMTIKDLVPELQEKWPNSFAADAKSGGGMKPTNKQPSNKKEELDSKGKIKAGLMARMKQQ